MSKGAVRKAAALGVDTRPLERDNDIFVGDTRHYCCDIPGVGCDLDGSDGKELEEKVSESTE